MAYGLRAMAHGKSLLTVDRGPETVDVAFPLTISGGPIAQWLERPAHNRLVPGSNPGGPTHEFKVQSSKFWELWTPDTSTVNCFEL